MPIFLLVRHGENDFVKEKRLAGRLPGIHLNENGILQVENLAQKLAKTPIKAVYSSPLERAVETAQPIAAQLSLELISRQGLIEIDIGDWQGKLISELRRLAIWKKVQLAPSRMRFPGGETFAEAQTRMVIELETLARMHQEKDCIICVSHCDPIKLAAAYYLGMPLNSFQRLIVSPATITMLEIGARGVRLLGLNQTNPNESINC